MKLLSFFANKFFLINLFIAFIFIGVLGWLGLSFLDNYTKHGESITVPDLKNLTLEQTEQILKNKQLKFQIMDSTYIAGKLPLTVLEQSPEALSKVKQNRTIYLTVNSIIPPSVKMPNLKDVSLRQATLILESYGLKVGELIYKPDLAQNAVLEQQISGVPIAPMTSVNKGSVIDLVLGNGLGNTLVSLPNLVGYKLEEAKFILQGSSLNIGLVIVDKTVTDTLSAIVYKQSPLYSENLKLNMGESVDIFLSKTLKRDTAKKN